MNVLLRHLAPVTLLAMLNPGSASTLEAQQWSVHDLRRPPPPAIDPGSTERAPSDAVVLFAGKDLSQWKMKGGEPAAWKVEGGYFEVVPASGDLVSVPGFGDCQLHIEWATPAPPSGEGQDRGNSGVYFMGLYELQVLDSYRSRTYADGQAGALYGQFPPLVNASRPPGAWQEYDIVFHPPRFGQDGKLQRPARMTVFHNRVLVQDDVVLTGAAAHKAPAKYSAHADRLPLVLQDHGSPVRYRNIWVRELPAP